MSSLTRKVNFEAQTLQIGTFQHLAKALEATMSLLILLLKPSSWELRPPDHDFLDLAKALEAAMSLCPY